MAHNALKGARARVLEQGHASDDHFDALEHLHNRDASGEAAEQLSKVGHLQ